MQQRNIQEKQQVSRRKTCQERYGGPNENYKRILKESYDILNNKKLFAEMLGSNSCISMATKLGCGANLISTRHRKFGLNILKTNISSYENEISIWVNYC